jgi:hypothetical protein
MSGKKKKYKKVSEISDKVMYLTVRDYTNDPFFVKKAERAQEIMDKHGAQLLSLLKYN